MKGITVANVGAEWKITEDLPVPEPADDQILVKSVYAAVNPVEYFMAGMGLMVTSWPLTPGCDTGGVVVKAGKKAVSPLGTPFKEGDRVCGCTRLAWAGYSPYREYFLMDSSLTLPVPEKITLAQASTIGVASYTAGLGVFYCLDIPVPDPENLPLAKDEWVLVLGGASSVGKLTVQILKTVGYKVIATASASSFELIKSIGADAVVDYKKPQEEVMAEIVSKTGGKLFRIFDAVAQHTEFFVPMFKALPEGGKKYFSGTNDWDPYPKSDVEAEPVRLGPVGRPEATKLNKEINSFIPYLYKMLEAGKISPSEYVEVGDGGFESLIEGYAFQTSGKGGNKKVIVKVADP